MKRWDACSDKSKAFRSAGWSLFCGAIVVFLPKFVPPFGVVNTLGQLMVLCLALLWALSAGIHLHKAYPDEDW